MNAIEATPETLAKLQLDPVLWLRVYHPSMFGIEHERAAKEIEKCVRLLAGQLMVRAQDVSRIGRSQPREYTKREAAMLCAYANWQEEMKVRKVPAWAVYEVAVEGKRPEEIAAERKSKLHRVLEWLQFGLARYAEMRGWMG